VLVPKIFQVAIWKSHLGALSVRLNYSVARLCSKENVKEPFGLPSVLAWVPRTKRWSPKLKFRGALWAPKHFSWGAQASYLEFFVVFLMAKENSGLFR